MIGDALVRLVAWIVKAIVSRLPVGSLGLPASNAVGSWIGTRVGPVDRYLPIADMATSLVITIGIWLPGVLAYMTANWVYRHIPFVGGG